MVFAVRLLPHVFLTHPRVPLKEFFNGIVSYIIFYIATGIIMKKLGKTVRSLAAYEDVINKLGTFRLAATLPEEMDKQKEIGFDAAPNDGDSILPAAIGRISNFNANGSILIRKDLPKVRESKMGWRTWNDWHGNPHSGVQIRSIEIYPRERVLPPSEYIEAKQINGKRYLCSRVFSRKVDSEETILHAVNLFLELFGTFQLTNPMLEAPSAVQVKRLNWRILPQGAYPFARAKNELSEFLNAIPEGDKSIVLERIKAITQYSPDFVAVGLGGFKDYVVFGFSKTGCYVLESPSLGNATYVLNQDWQQLSTFTKKQILDGSLHEARLIHNNKWRTNLRETIAKKA